MIFYFSNNSCDGNFEICKTRASPGTQVYNSNFQALKMKKNTMVDKYGFVVNHRLTLSQKAIYQNLSHKKYYSQSLISQIIANKTGDKICLQDLKQHWWLTTQSKKPTFIQSVQFFREILDNKEYNMSSVYKNMRQKFPDTPFASQQYTVMYMKKVFSKTIRTVQKLAQQKLQIQIVKTTTDQRKRAVKNLISCHRSKGLKKPNILRYFLLHLFLNFLTRKSVPISDIQVIYNYQRDFIQNYLAKRSFDQKVGQFIYQWTDQELQKLYRLYIKKNGNLWQVQRTLIRQDCQKQQYQANYLKTAYYRIIKIGYEKLKNILANQLNYDVTKQVLNYSEFKDNLIKITKSKHFYEKSVKIMDIAFDKTLSIDENIELYQFCNKQFGKPKNYKKRGRKRRIVDSQPFRNVQDLPSQQENREKQRKKQISVKQQHSNLQDSLLKLSDEMNNCRQDKIFEC